MATVYIYRGLPGSGKSTQLNSNHPKSRKYCRAFSADYFWIGPQGEYNFDPKKIGEAHAWCFHKYMNKLREMEGFEYPKTSAIVVDNTSISAWEIAPYVLAASAYGFEHEIITVWADPVMCIKRNVHNVPAHVIMAMYQRLLTETLPPFWKHTIICPEFTPDGVVS